MVPFDRVAPSDYERKARMGRALGLGGVGGSRGLAGGRLAHRAAPRRRARIVLVDDLAYVREPIAEVLREAGFEVIAVENGPSALAELAQGTVDLLLTDLYMPDMSGWDLARAVRARRTTNERGQPVCIGLYSAMLSGFTREQLTRAQVDFAVTKMGDPSALIDAIERALAWAEV